LLHGGRRRCLDAVEDERVGRLLDEVEDVVERADQGVDVLAVEGGDECRLEPVPDLVADLVAAVLGRPDLGSPGVGLVVGPEHRLELARAAQDIRGVLDEQVEEADVAGDQAETQGGFLRARRWGRRKGTAAITGLCDARRVDWIFVAFVGLLAIALAIAIGVALDRDRALEATRAALARSSLGLGPLAPGSAVDRDAPGTDVGRQTDAEADDPTADVPTLVRRLRDRLDASEFELDQQVRNASYLADLMGVGIVRLDEQGRVELANAAAHILLRRPTGSLTGRTTLETFLDSRVEELIAMARAGGGASGEFRLSGPDGPTLVVRARRIGRV